MKINRVCVFCASADKIDQEYKNQAYRLGEILATNNIAMNYGGGDIGLMGEIANAMLANNGSVRGIIPKFMIDAEWAHKGVDDMVITQTMAQRKTLLAKDVDAVIVLPGSTGTLEEVSEVLSNKKLGLFSKPIIIVNTNGFYNPLLKMLNTMVEEHFMKSNNGLWTEIDSVENIISSITNNKA